MNVVFLTVVCLLVVVRVVGIFNIIFPIGSGYHVQLHTELYNLLWYLHGLHLLQIMHILVASMMLTILVSVTFYVELMKQC